MGKLLYEEETGEIINYLHGTKLNVGLLVNFAEASLKWERLTRLEKQTDLLTPNGTRICSHLTVLAILR